MFLKIAIKSIIRRIYSPIENRLRRIEEINERSLILQSSIWREHFRVKNRLRDAEFRVFSQWGEDGIIQYLVAAVAIESPQFVEIGVEDYRESNTRYLAMSSNWTGLLIDGSAGCINDINQQSVTWRHGIIARRAFVDKDNVNSLIAAGGIRGRIGLLSIDIDGNDYWVWEALNVIEPSIVVIEYNPLWGKKDCVAVPYDPKFIRSEKHYSNVYYGASLRALVDLGRRKGYRFVGCNSAGTNAFFLRADIDSKIPSAEVDHEYSEPRFREARTKSGRLSYCSLEEQRKMLRGLPLIDVRTGATITMPV
jgi:hypothetical protein